MRSGQLRIAFVLFTCGLLGLAGCGEEGAMGGLSAAEASRVRASNASVLGATSPFEDLIEFATSADEPGMDSAIAAIADGAPAVRAALDSVSRLQFDARVSAIRAARGAGDYGTVALASVEGYRVLVDALDERVLTVPKAVSLLDYAGFKMLLLAGSVPPDWDAMRRTLDEARGFWSSIEARVERKGLRDGMNTTLDGMREAVDARDARLAAFAARVDLDLVDLLEVYFDASVRADTDPREAR